MSLFSDHNLKLSFPMFEDYVKSIHPKYSRWIQYTGYEVVNKNQLLFIFNTSTGTISFKIYAGVYMGPHMDIELDIEFPEIYEFFRNKKREILGPEYNN